MLAALTVVAGAQAAPVVTVLKGFDPIELIDGREVAGSESISITRGRYRYLFATEANKRKFEKSPEEHQIQLGGGCGRMGSLSGAGNPDRYYVFDWRIYIFASEQCRNGFKAAPEKHLEAPDAPPSGTPAELRRGRELVALALKGLEDVVKTYSDFREVSGLILPFKVEESFNGKPVTSPVVTYESVRINGPLDTNLFMN